MSLEVPAKRLRTRKADEVGREKQTSPLEVERREKDGDLRGSKSERGRKLLQVARAESYRGKRWKHRG